MHRLSIISDSVDAGEIARQVAGMFETESFSRQSFPRSEPAQYTIVDIDLTDSSHISDLRHWLLRRPKDGKAIFVVEHGVRRQAAQAYAVGATDLLERPLNRKMLLTKLLGDIDSLVGDPAALSIGNSLGVLTGIEALQAVFASFVSGAPIELKMVEVAAQSLASNIEAEGLANWIDVVRKHHSRTYQHCLLVTGIAVTFGRHLGFSSTDKEKLASGGLLHDLGKAGIPLALLEKPGPLVGDEVTVMMRHPQLGFEALREVRGLDSAMLDIVVHHHEYLDGSGYPHGLRASELPDLVRMMTIADIFGALIERRAYKAPLTCEAACQILEQMGPKLDPDLVREFQSFAQV
jgi:putative nucleotidyltransferase with HDIG domain